MKRITILISLLVVLALPVTAQVEEAGRISATMTATNFDGTERKLTLKVEQKQGEIRLTGLDPGMIAFVTGATLGQLTEAGFDKQAFKGDPETLFLAIVVPTPNPRRSKSKYLPLGMKKSAIPADVVRVAQDKEAMFIYTPRGYLDIALGTFSVAPSKGHVLLDNLMPEDRLVVFYFRVRK